ncbi:E3 SUMO-protein ligase KIAA1586 [Galendromus occidentalis]|uniref:E3 SUMO-protein ligase KIAA1586 n=1 Tax=Galendromus occidentalis TaxID=34638 RepID=A0AAJ6QMV0_9ACAR|nr:E3 SUMO-protein ligase KIAA1586 [Galendromus occidentalis]
MKRRCESSIHEPLRKSKLSSETETPDEALVSLDLDLGSTDDMLIGGSLLINNSGVVDSAAEQPPEAEDSAESSPQGAVAAEGLSEQVAEVGMSIIDDEWVEEGDGTWPEVWTQDMWMDRRAKHHWLSSKKRKLGCRYCFRVKYMGYPVGDNIGLSTEWINYLITCSGESREQRLKSLRNKIQRHEVSRTHLRSEALIKNYKDSPPTRSLMTNTLNKNVHMTSQIFRHVYELAKLDINFDVYPSRFNAVLREKIYRDFAFVQDFDPIKVVQHIAEDLRSTFVKEITAQGFRFSIIVDHVQGWLTTAETVFLIYIRAKTNDGLRNLFWDAISYSENQMTETSPLSAITQSLLDGGFSHEFLNNHLMCFVTDPLGTHLGAETSLCHQLAVSFEKIVIWYVLAYRLELMVMTALRNNNSDSYVCQLYEILHSLTQLSERNGQELLINTPEVYEQLSRIGPVVPAREVASSYRAIQALTDAYSILFEYLVQAGNDITRTTEEKEKYSYAKTLMESEQLVREIGMVHDVLKLLSTVRTDIDNDCDIAHADCILVKAMEDLAQLASCAGAFEVEVLNELSSRSFMGVALTNSSELCMPDRNAFMEQIVALSKQNMISVSGLGEDIVENFISDLFTVNVFNWPPNPPENYADDAVRRLCTVFDIADETGVRSAFRAYIENGRKAAPANMALLQTFANVFPQSTSLVSSTVAKINKLTPVKSPDAIGKLSAALFLHINGGSAEQFEPLSLVRTWCSKYPLVADSRAAKRKKPEQSAKWTPVEAATIAPPSVEVYPIPE